MTTARPAPSISSRPHLSPLTQLLTTQAPDQTTTRLALPLEILHNLRHQHSWTDLTLHYISSTPARPPRPTLRPLPLPLSTVPPSLGTNPDTPLLISGQPPRPVYIHPDQQSALLKASIATTTTSTNTPGSSTNAADASPTADGTSTPIAAPIPSPANIPLPPAPREWVIPLTLSTKPNVRWLSGIFDALPTPPAPSAPTSTPTSTPAPAAPATDVPADVPAAPLEPATGTDTGTEAATETRESGSGRRDSRDGGKRVLLAIKGEDGTVAYYVCLEGEVKPRQNG